jgi:uncharacterized membrane protein
LVLVAALALRTWKLGEKNLWLDEAASWDLATSSIARLIALTAADIHPPLYYLALKLWVWIFGDSVGALRSLSVVSGVLAVYLMYRLAERGLETNESDTRP